MGRGIVAMVSVGPHPLGEATADFVWRSDRLCPGTRRQVLLLLHRQWELAHGTTARSKHPHGGTLLLGEWPEDFYLEADVILDAEDAEFHLLFNAAPDLLQGYQLALCPRLDEVELRPISKWDVDRVLETAPVSVEARRPVKLRLFRHGSILDVFVADRATLTHRLYSHRGGRLALEYCDTTGSVTNLLARRLK